LRVSERYAFCVWKLSTTMSLFKAESMTFSLGIPPTAMPEQSDTKKTTFIKRNQIAATIGRYLTQAETIIANTGLGIFP
jgi:hypothetical protein